MRAWVDRLSPEHYMNPEWVFHVFDHHPYQSGLWYFEVGDNLEGALELLDVRSSRHILQMFIEDFLVGSIASTTNRPQDHADDKKQFSHERTLLSIWIHCAALLLLLCQYLPKNSWEIRVYCHSGLDPESSTYKAYIFFRKWIPHHVRDDKVEI